MATRAGGTPTRRPGAAMPRSGGGGVVLLGGGLGCQPCTSPGPADLSKIAASTLRLTGPPLGGPPSLLAASGVLMKCFGGACPSDPQVCDGGGARGACDMMWRVGGSCASSWHAWKDWPRAAVRQTPQVISSVLLTRAHPAPTRARRPSHASQPAARKPPLQPRPGPWFDNTRHTHDLQARWGLRRHWQGRPGGEKCRP